MIKLPVPDDEVLRLAFALIERMDVQNYKKGQNVEFGDNYPILKSPNGTRYKITVTNAGVLGTAAV